MKTDHWPSLGRSWAEAGPPLRPNAEDLAAYSRLAQSWIARHEAPPRILLLGVTPEIYRLPWPPGHDFLAVERSAAMIEHVWPGPSQQVLRGDWLELPLPSASRDLAFCDGGLHLLDHPRGQQRLVEQLHRVLGPGGLCFFRLYALPETPESPEAVLADLLHGHIPNLNVLKLRLGMAMQPSPEAGVKVHDIRSRLHALAGSWEALAARLGWSLEHLQVIDAYFQSPASYHFLSVPDAQRLFTRDDRFLCREVRAPAYLLGERCPIVVFERL